MRLTLQQLYLTANQEGINKNSLLKNSPNKSQIHTKILASYKIHFIHNYPLNKAPRKITFYDCKISRTPGQGIKTAIRFQNFLFNLNQTKVL